ncbi:hypothetical protein SB6413_04533 [Klebsiella pasteurii]|nr:hypothetical protein SB6413_04533 [Klebsiella pasteurii]
MLGGADNSNGELPSYIIGANKLKGRAVKHFLRMEIVTASTFHGLLPDG